MIGRALLVTRLHPGWFWSTSAATLLAILLWMLGDPYFETTALNSATNLRLVADVENGVRSEFAGGWREATLAASIGFACILQAAMLVGLLIGSRQHRQLRSWFVFLTLSGLWLALATSWRDVTFLGKQHRLQKQLADFESVAAPLRNHWPSEDGQLHSGEPFMAYPVGDPVTLILLMLPERGKAGTSFSVVERDKSGCLRFQLTGREQFAWLEWHPADHLPSSFVGGLLDAHALDRFRALGDGWYVVRYKL